jgi:hypothetical protein
MLRAKHEAHNGPECRSAGDAHDKKAAYGGLKVGVKEWRSTLARDTRPQRGIQQFHSIDVNLESSPADDVIGLNLVRAPWLIHDEANARSNRSG